MSERSSPSRVRCNAKNVPLTAAGRSEIPFDKKEWDSQEHAPGVDDHIEFAA
jgi:hypothetical protein